MHIWNKNFCPTYNIRNTIQPVDPFSIETCISIYNSYFIHKHNLSHAHACIYKDNINSTLLNSSKGKKIAWKCLKLGKSQIKVYNSHYIFMHVACTHVMHTPWIYKLLQDSSKQLTYLLKHFQWPNEYITCCMHAFTITYHGLNNVASFIHQLYTSMQVHN